MDLDEIEANAPQKTTTISTTSTTTSTTTVRTTTPAPRRSLLQQKKECRAQKSNSPACIRILDKCINRVFRATHSGCAKQKGDDEWLIKKCKTEVFYNKFKSSCQGLCVNVLFSLKNPKICKEAAPSNNEEDNIESLADIVEKCKKPFYKTKFKEKCEVVETIDTILINENSDEDKEEEKDKTDGMENEKTKKVEHVNNNIDAAKVKGDIVKSIERQTQERKEIPKKSSNKKKEKDSKSKVSKIKGSKKNKGESKKKKNDKKKAEGKGNAKGKGKKKDKVKKKEKPKKEKKNSKHKCNKLKYRITHPVECKDMQRMEDIILNKCRKEKYRNKHKERCQSIDSSNNAELTNIVITQVADIRCQKESFRKSYPSLCKDSKDKETLDNNAEWLSERCKHEKFSKRNTQLCSSLATGQSLPSDVSIVDDLYDDTDTNKENFNTSSVVADEDINDTDRTTVANTDSPATESITSHEELTTVDNMSLVA